MAIVHLGNILPGTAYASGLDTRIPWSALEYYGGTEVITGISGSAIGGNIDSATVSAIASSYVVSGVSGKMDSSASSQFQPSGDYAYTSSLTGYQPTGDYAYNSSLSGYQPSGDYYSATNPRGFVDSSYVASAISGKMDSSASSSFYPSDNPSGFITGVDLSEYVPISAVSSWSSQIETLSAMVTALEQRVPTAVYTLSAGYGISIVNDDENQVTTIGTV